MINPEDVPPGLCTDAPPEDPRVQIVAWAIDIHGLGVGEEDPKPRWMVVQWARPYEMTCAAWMGFMPGRQTVVRVLGWLPLPALDAMGERIALRTERVDREAAELIACEEHQPTGSPTAA